MEFSCNYLFTEEVSAGGVRSLHPIILKLDIPPVSVKALFIPRMKYAASLPIEHLAVQPEHDGKFIIVGTGPTLDLNKISSGKICTINRAHEYLIENGIVPDIHILYESDVSTLEQPLGGPPHKGVTYYVCSVNCGGVFDQLNDHKVSLWHTKFPGDEYQQFVESLFPGEPLVDTPPAVSFIKAIGIGRVLGYRNFELHGIDCSFPLSGRSDHINGSEEVEEKLNVCGKNKANVYRRYSTTGSYVHQIIEFMTYSKSLNVKIYGDGLLGFVAPNG